jgi:AcrR family transcriptional regulator
MKAGASRRGAPRRGQPSARDRLVETVTEPFYQEGIRAIGIDTVVARSGVSKSSLYRTFASKDTLIAAFAEEQNRRYWQWWDDIVRQFYGAHRAQIDALLTGVADQIASPQFRGCTLINLATEFPSHHHPGTAIAYGNKKEMRQRLRVLSRPYQTDDWQAWFIARKAGQDAPLPAANPKLAKHSDGQVPACPRMALTVLPARQSQMRMTLSSPTETSCLPSGVKAISLIFAMCPPVSEMAGSDRDRTFVDARSRICGRPQWLLALSAQQATKLHRKDADLPVELPTEVRLST